MTKLMHYRAMSFLLALPLALAMVNPQPARADDGQAAALNEQAAGKLVVAETQDDVTLPAVLDEAVEDDGASATVDDAAVDVAEDKSGSPEAQTQDSGDNAQVDNADAELDESSAPQAGAPEGETVADQDATSVATEEPGQEELDDAATKDESDVQALAEPETTAATPEDAADPLTAIGDQGQQLYATGTMNGVDISGWNPNTNLSVLSADFVIIKATEWNKSAGSYTSYTTNLEGRYSSYIEQANAALAAGKKIGFYHFVTNPNAGRNAGGKTYVEQAQGFIDAIRNYIGQAIMVLDWENAQLSTGAYYSYVESDVDGAKQWLDYVYQHTGVKPLIYMNKNCTNSYDWSKVKNAGYELWGAMYLNANADKTSYISNPDYSAYGGWGAWGARPTIYQYSSTAILPGSGNEIDVNVFYGTANDWDQLAGSSTRWVENEGSYYYLSNGSIAKNTWVVTSKSPTNSNSGLQRYWVDAQGKLAMGRLITSSEAGYYAYAMPTGAVVRGSYAVGDKVYLADNSGQLASAGWVVSQAYGHGLQRYYIDAATHAAIVGYSPAGYDHYTIPTGYVARGRYNAPNGYIYLADNDGLLESPGWLVTDKYGQGLQRYYIDAIAHACVPGFSSDGWNHYTTERGPVARGRYVDRGGSVWIANNEGKLTSNRALTNGWLVTDALGHGLQRYWVENGDITYNKLIQVASGVWAFARPNGYVVRGKYIAPNGYVYLANNDGQLVRAGWHVSGSYGDGLQRYYIDATAHACVPGYSTDGYAHYTLTKGYVLRSTSVDGGEMRAANNDGLIWDGWIVTNAFGQNLQRYWQSGGKVVKGELVKTGNNSWAYCRPEGYVVRGKYTAHNGYVYLANNDGGLENAGWVITKAYNNKGDYERYYIDKTAHAAIPGYSSEGYAHYTTSDGTVLRNANYIMSKKAYAADNDGKLVQSTTAATSIINAANAVGAPTTGLDSEWVINVLVRAGLQEAAGRSPYAYKLYSDYCNKTSTSDLMVGMVVAVPNTSATIMGKTYGMSGIYVGNNTIMCFDGTSVLRKTVDEWKSTFGKNATPKWGWFAGVVLA